MAAVGAGEGEQPLIPFDEPSLGIAPILVSEIFGIVKTINERGVTVLLVEQNVKHTLAMCHRAYILENGRIAMTGTGEEFLNNQQVKEAYLDM